MNLLQKRAVLLFPIQTSVTFLIILNILACQHCSYCLHGFLILILILSEVYSKLIHSISIKFSHSFYFLLGKLLWISFLLILLYLVYFLIVYSCCKNIWASVWKLYFNHNWYNLSFLGFNNYIGYRKST